MVTDAFSFTALAECCLILSLGKLLPDSIRHSLTFCCCFIKGKTEQYTLVYYVTRYNSRCVQAVESGCEFQMPNTTRKAIFIMLIWVYGWCLKCWGGLEVKSPEPSALLYGRRYQTLQMPQEGQ